MTMTIKDISAGKGGIVLTATVIDKQQAREFEKFGKMLKVCNVILKDSTGTISLSLWNEQIDQIKVGDTVLITNGYASEFKGNVQISTGKFGTLQVMTSASDGVSLNSAVTTDEKEEAQLLDSDLDEPDLVDEVTEDELAVSEIPKKKPSVRVTDDVDIEEEHIE